MISSQITSCMKVTHLYRSLRPLHYVQGQNPKPNLREYFYYIDHQGQLFLDDSRMKNFTSCFKEKQFLSFFFKRLQTNDSDRYTNDFPYLSPCGREKNYIRCDDLPIVFTDIITTDDNKQLLSYGGAGRECTVPFHPKSVCMLPWTGRIYHPAPGLPGEIGLIKSAIAMEWSKLFEFAHDDENEEKPPISFRWLGKQYKLSNELLDTATAHRLTYDNSCTN